MTMKKRESGPQPDENLQKQKTQPDMPQDSGADDVSDEQDAKKKGLDSNQAGADKHGGEVGKQDLPGTYKNDGQDEPDGIDAKNGSGDVKDAVGVDSGKQSPNRGVRPYDGKSGSPLTDTPVDAGKGPSAGQFVAKGAKGFGNGLKTAVFGGAAGISGAVMNGFKGAGGKVTHVVSNVSGKLGNALGIPKTVAGALAGIVLCTSVAGGGMMVADYNYEQKMMSQEMVLEDDCAEDADAARETSTAVVGDEQEEQNAAKAWAVFKAIGLSDEQAAGALGNMTVEGGFSPYTMECDFITAPDEKWGIGPKKQGFIKDLNSWTLNFVFPYYKISLNKAFYGTSRHGYVGGVGLFGFTGCNYDDLEDWAAGLGTTWCDQEKAFDVQMSFIIAPGANGGYGGPGGASEWLLNWGSNPSGCGSPAGAAEVFCHDFEGNPCGQNKKDAANKWFAKFAGTMGDTSYADSILQMANASRAGAAGDAAKDANEDCGVEEKEFDNSDLARAAVAYAYETTAEGRGNDGTELYQAVHRAIFPGDPWFQSCDRGVATAVRWSDADDNFPAGPCTTILPHCNGDTDHWEYKGRGVSMQDAGELQPGDVCVCTGHIVMYTGHDLIAEKFPSSDPSSDFVSASLNERSPGCGHVDFHSDTRDYYVFRLKHYDEPGQYKDVVAGQTLNDR